LQGPKGAKEPSGGMPSASFQIGLNGGEVRGVDLWDFSRTKRSQLFHPHAQRNAFRRRGAHLQSRSFARWNESLRHSLN
jgi:hypothetical protein